MLSHPCIPSSARCPCVPPVELPCSSLHSHEDVGMGRNLSDGLCTRLILCSVLAFCLPLRPVLAQETGTVKGTVTRAMEGGALSSVSVTVQSTGQSTVTGNDGRYTLRRVPAGPQTVVFRWLGYRPTQAQVIVEANAT